MLRYQVNCLLDRKDIVRVFRSNSLTSRCVQDCVMNDGVNSSREQNPSISCQILEHDVFLLGSRVGLWQCRIERPLGECHARDLRVFGWCHHQRQI